MARQFDERLIIEVLRGASARVASGWTAGHQARTERGEPVPPEHPLARCFCTFGAIRAESLERCPDARPMAFLLAEASAKYLGAMLKFLGYHVRSSASHSVMQWNDEPGRTHEEVVAMFEKTVDSLTRRIERQAS